jgi:hypothetical protein
MSILKFLEIWTVDFKIFPPILCSFKSTTALRKIIPIRQADFPLVHPPFFTHFSVFRPYLRNGENWSNIFILEMWPL